jgi:hypothetical protein
MDSSPDNDGTVQYDQMGRVRQSRPEGIAKANRWVKLRKSRADSNLVDTGRFAVLGRQKLGGGRLRSWSCGVSEEATVNVCGVAVAMLPGYSRMPYLADRSAVNVGTACGRPL